MLRDGGGLLRHSWPRGGLLRDGRPRGGLGRLVGRCIRGPAAILLALIDARPALAELLPHGGIAVGDAFAMVGIVLPRAVVDRRGVVRAVDMDRAIDVDVHVAVAASPVPAAEDRAGSGEPDAEHDAARQRRAVAVDRLRRIK